MTCVARPLFDGLVRVGLQELGLRLGMAGIAYLIHPSPHQAIEVRTMRIVAGAAHVLGKGWMDALRFLQFAGLRMAGETQFSVLGDQKVLVLRCMGGVAGQTAVPARYRPMADRDFRLFVRVARKTKLIALLDDQFRVFRGMRIMAGEAHPAREGRVLDGASGLQRRCVVTLVAELRTALRRSEGLL